MNRKTFTTKFNKRIVISQKVEGEAVNFTYELTLTPRRGRWGEVHLEAEGWVRDIYATQRDRPVEW